MALKGGVVQGRVALQTQHIGAGASLQQQLDEVGVAAARRVMQRSPVRVFGVDLGA